MSNIKPAAKGARDIASYFRKPVKSAKSSDDDDFSVLTDGDSSSKDVVEDSEDGGEDGTLSEGVPSDNEESDAPIKITKPSRAPKAVVSRYARIQTSENGPQWSNQPPISDIPSMFKDIVKRVPQLKELAEKIQGRPLRVATMCSGTESPLLALGLISRALREDHGVELEIEHVFSCEIEPFKQAYIERNFHPPILFRDVCELGADEATTAYGAKVKVPGNVDVLIAGTSCVDYSSLNNEKQDIDANGESGRTFRGMLQWVAKHRPTIVILENVCSAPWDRVVKKFEGAMYSAIHQRFDTKNYYIPHTRTRGYLMAINIRDSPLPSKWKAKVQALARPASSTLDAFLLASDDPRIHQARQKLVHEGAIIERKAGYDWGRCESRHLKARHEEELGSRRPLTGWEEGGTSKLPSFAWNDWSANQVDRVWDLMDITTLRAASVGKDSLFKTEVWNLSQNVDRQIGSSRIGIAPCLTPTMIAYITNRGGPMVGMEALGLQGLPVDELLLTRETEDQLADLAGNAMSSTVIGTAIVAALVVCHKNILPTTKDEDAMDVDGATLEADLANKAILGEEQLLEQPLDLSTPREHSLPALLTNASSSVRLCDCEGRDDIIQRVVQRCVDCGSTACVKCGGRPEHNFEVIDVASAPRLHPAEYRKQLMEQLPMSVSLHGITSPLLEECKSSVLGVADSRWEKWMGAVLAISAHDLHFKEDKRKDMWTVTYESTAALLEFHLHPLRPEWLLYAKPSETEPANSKHRALLAQPVARLLCKHDLFDGTWDIAIPVMHSFKLTIEGSGELVPAWEARLGLEKEEFKNKTVWSTLALSYPDQDSERLDRPISGSYTLLDKCGTANAGLHKKDGEDPTVAPLFLFLDPTRCGSPSDDCFVLSSSIRRTEYGEYRPIVATIDKSWRPNSREGPTTVVCHTHCKWVPVPTIHMKPTENLIAKYSTPPAPLQITIENDACCSARAVLVCKVPMSAEQADQVWPHDKWYTVDAIRERPTFRAISWLIERIRIVPHLGTWITLDLPTDHSNCERCAPTPPAIKWLRTQKGMVAAEDALQAGRYEQALKHRPSPFVTQLKLDVGSSVGTVRLGINVPSLLHRALSRLPARHGSRGGDPILSWRMTTDYTPPARLLPPKFRLTSNRKDVPHDQPPNFRLDLRPEQLRSLHWMLQQESDDAPPFLEEEISEAILHPLGWRIEGKAQRPVHVSGGVLADEVGYGKTAITLGLIDSTQGTLPKRKKPLNEGKIPTNATLIVVPAHLTRQWASEIKKFMGKKYNVVTLETMQHLNKATVQDILDADIILLASRLVKSDIYLANFQSFAAGGSLPSKEGRYFDAKLQQAHASLREQTKRLKEEGASAVLEVIKEAAETKQAEQLVQTKRLKGRQYRDKMHQDTILEPVFKKLPDLIAEVVITGAARKKPAHQLMDVDEDSDRSVPSSPTRGMKTNPIALSSDEEEDMTRHPKGNKDRVSTSKSTAKESSKSTKTAASTKIIRKSAVKKRKSEVLADASPDSINEEEGEDEYEDESEENSKPPKKKLKATSSGPVKDAKKPHQPDPWHLKSHSVRKDWREMLCPPLELFHFNRIVVDEYTYVDGKIYPLITNLVSNHRWILSGTPPTQDFASVKTIAAFMGLHLGINDDFWEGQSKEALREAKKRQKDQTSAENFHSFREVHSLDWHGHRNEVAQGFLDQFVRQNIAEIDEIPFEDVIWPITLPAAERAIYLELEHHLRALDMTIRKGKKTDSDREKRMQQSLGNSNTAEEALLKRCSHFELEADRENALKACEVIVEERTRQLKECTDQLRSELQKAFTTEKKLGHVDYNSHFQQWLRMTHSDSGVGDNEAKARLHKAQSKAGFNYEENEARRKKKNPHDFEGESQKTKEDRWAHREHAHVLKKLEKELVGRVRSLRYFTVVRDLQRKSSELERIDCVGCDKTDLPISDIAVLSSCGHTGCHSCVITRAQNEECVARQSEGCTAPARVLNVIKAETLGVDEERGSDEKHFGKKLEKLVHLIQKEMPKKDRVLLFVQFPDLMKKVAEALDASGVSFLEIKGTNSAKSKNLEKFQDPEGKEKVLLLNVGDESASGANLTTANHVIFVSPLLTASQQFYEATDTQAIGRLRRFGQQKKVHIYRFLTLNSIDVEIFEARDGRKVL